MSAEILGHCTQWLVFCDCGFHSGAREIKALRDLGPICVRKLSHQPTFHHSKCTCLAISSTRQPGAGQLLFSLQSWSPVCGTKLKGSY